MKTAALCILAAILFAAGLIGLFPMAAAHLLADAMHVYSIGFSASDGVWHMLGVLGGGASVAGVWMLSLAFGRSSAAADVG